MDIVNKVKEIIEPVLNEKQYYVDSITYELEGKTYFLRIVIDKEGIIDVEDCVQVCQMINPLLDEADLIRDSYILDVCSKEKGSVSDEQ